ncbi:hypothetical protein [Priestia megaterium]|uniref:hypothetical protein n=1 Tax=Priestia megaterium TaxID=1404 RepID=UPI003D00FA20
METTKTHIIQIDWDGPYKITELPQLTDSISDYGIYQIYGYQPVYGNDVLLYIGKADQQTFGKRIPQENWWGTNDSNNIKIYVGRLLGPQTPNQLEWSLEIDLAEQLLIYVHKPAYNARSVSSLRNLKIQDVHTLNWSNYRSLLPEVSGLRWTKKLDNQEHDVYKWM